MGVIANITTGINSPRSQLIRIETLVLIGIVTLFLLLVLGSYRRQCSHEAVKLIVWAAYTVSYTLVSYTTGLMQTYQYGGSSLFAVWVVCLLLILGNVDSISAYSLHDNDNWKRIYIRQLVQFFWVGWIVGEYGEPKFNIPVWTIYGIAVFTTSTLTESFQLASKSYSLPACTKWVADYMKYEHEQQNSLVPNPRAMHGYGYVVTGENDIVMHRPAPDYITRLRPDDPKLVTVEQIWTCKAKLLHPQYLESSRLKDICLSMALSKMLNRRFAGFHLAESKLEKTRAFVFQGLLSGEGDDRYERAFRVIEVELGFVHDFFYTKYYVLFSSHNNRSYAIIFPALSFPFCVWLAYLLFERFQTPPDKQTYSSSSSSSPRNYDALVTMIIVLGIAVLQVLQLYFYFASDWCKVYLISKYVKKTAWQNNPKIEKRIAFIVSQMKTFRHWQNKVGQYSLLHKFNYRAKYKNALCRLTFGLVEKTKIGRDKETIDLTNEVKKAVIDSLVRSSGRLTNGVTALRANGAEQLMWACTGLPTLTHSILIWHIATSLCECEHKRKLGGEGEAVEMRTYVSVASNLSKYCAYLVAFAPNLLPGHAFDTEAIRITDPRLRWKVLSEFWAEMMLYVTPSSDATVHLETLTRGGEFITHLWTLLTHAGILQRDESSGTP